MRRAAAISAAAAGAPDLAPSPTTLASSLSTAALSKQRSERQYVPKAKVAFWYALIRSLYSPMRNVDAKPTRDHPPNACLRSRAIATRLKPVTRHAEQMQKRANFVSPWTYLLEKMSSGTARSVPHAEVSTPLRDGSPSFCARTMGTMDAHTVASNDRT